MKLAYQSSTSAPEKITPLTLRDPGGCLLDVDGKLIRGVYPHFISSVEKALGSFALRKCIAEGSFIPSYPVETQYASTLKDHLAHSANTGSQSPVVFLEHPRVPFISYPYEWAPQMLHAAGKLTLDLADLLLDEDLELKDATPNNVLFQGPEPIFIDLLSVTERNRKLPLWLAFGQFTRTILHPIMAYHFFHMPLSTSMHQHHDGISTTEMYTWASWRRRFSPSFLTAVSLPHWLSVMVKNPAQSKLPSSDPEKAKYIVKMFLKNLRRQLNNFAPKATSSHWTTYEAEAPSYTSDAKKAKQQTLSDWISQMKPGRVLDLGCNTGEFSVMCAQQKCDVVAVDSDPATVGHLWTRARSQKLSILPLVVNLADPTPATGWRNREGKSFIDRANGQFDCVFALALVHHLYLTHGIPASEIAEFLFNLTRKNCVVEFVGPEDAMAKHLNRRVDTLPLTQIEFERACARYFRTIKKEPIKGSDRCLYLLERNC